MWFRSFRSLIMCLGRAPLIIVIQSSRCSEHWLSKTLYSASSSAPLRINLPTLVHKKA